MPEKQKILIDTDIGDDVDDAFALVAAMDLGLEILGITTVFGNTRQRACVAKKLLRLYGNGYETVPVYAGWGRPLDAQEETYPDLCQYTPDLEREEYRPEGIGSAAAKLIADTCNRYGKDLTVVAIGPFTNLAQVLRRWPEALSRAGRVVIMGGAYEKQYADWNVMCDVSAAELLFSSLKNLECMGADVTHTLKVAPDMQRQVLNYHGQNRAMEYLSELCALWRKANPQTEMMLQDSLAVYYAADREICSMKKARVKVITDGYARGMTLNTDAYAKRWMNPAYREDRSEEVRYACRADGERILDDLRRKLAK